MVTSAQKKIVVGMGEIQVSKDPSVILACTGLGSCIAVCAYDPVSKVGGMAHIALPSSDGKDRDSSAKYADTAIPLLLRKMDRQGGVESRLIVKIAGGAQMSLAPGFNSAFKTGERNTAEVKTALARERIALVATDTGGSMGRTVLMFLNTGKVEVRTFGGESRQL